ncbi:PspC domain-containing protein [bacterium]|nr:PspC domain-containing protein [bacterium]
MREIRRSQENRVVAGVCGGLGEYFNIDPVIIRIIWLLLTFAAGGGILIYLICWVVIPSEY